MRNLKRAYAEYRALIINIDASGWNTRWRRDALAQVLSETLDKIFDYSIFSSTQKMYQQTLFYTEDDLYTMWWDGHEGGVEEQNQDTWLYTYIQEIKVALEGFDLPYHLLGRGDDMRVYVLIPPQYLTNRSMEQVRTAIVTSLSNRMKSFNHTIRVHDCYASKVFMAFGKISSVKSVELPMAYRKTAQSYGANNAFMPLLDDYIGSTLSNAHSASRMCMNLGHRYIVGLIWMYYYLLSTPEYKNMTDS